MEHFLAAFSNFANFSGRATRQQYWMFFLIYTIIAFVLIIIETSIGIPFLSTIFFVIMFIPSLAYGARRLHDTGRSGWWQLLCIIPLGFIVVLILCALEGKPEAQEQFELQAA